MKVSSIQYFHKLQKKDKLEDQNVLVIPDKDKIIHNIDELHEFLSTLKQDEYEHYIGQNNIFADWLKPTNKFLSKRIRKKKLDKVLKVLEKKITKK